MKRQSICSLECLCGRKIIFALTLGELTVEFSAQLLRNGMALRVMTSTDYQIGRFEVAADRLQALVPQASVLSATQTRYDRRDLSRTA